jgi:cytochrome P450
MSFNTLLIPSHVPQDLVRDLDIYHIEGSDGAPLEAWAKIKKEMPDLFYTPHYGGYWVVNSPELFDEAFSDPAVFSSERGAFVPETPPEVPLFGPLQMDPPMHRDFRHPYNLALSPKNVLALGERAREVVIECIDRIIDRGECEFMHEVAMHVPIAIVMQIFNFPYADRERLIPLVDTVTHSSDLQERFGAISQVMQYSGEYVGKRLQQPGDDLISKLLATKVGDRTMTPEEATASVTLLILGGLDTTSHTMGFIMWYLAKNPSHQQQLRENPSIIPQAIAELLRYNAISSTSRRLKQDRVVGGISMQAGDRIYLPLSMHALDDRAWPDAMTVDFNRNPKELIAFGKGVHKCVGMNLARSEITALIEEWFKRMPPFTVKAGAHVGTMTGQNLGIVHLPLTWASS